MVVAQPAHAAIEGRRPDGSVAALVDGEDAALGESVGWRVGPGSQPGAGGDEVGQTSSLSTDQTQRSRPKRLDVVDLVRHKYR